MFDTPSISAIDLEIQWQRLIAVMDEVDTATVKTSFSTIVGESRDFACILLDPRGASLCQSSFSPPDFCVSITRTSRAILERHPQGELRPGDVLVTNDPWIGDGHLPDYFVLTPVFHGGRVVAFLGTVAHVADVGGHPGDDHTINSGVVHWLKLNGALQGEVDLNAAVAGSFGVPVAFVSGDDQVVAQTLERYPDVETVITHRWVGTYASRAIAPVVSRERIRAGVERALARTAGLRPFLVAAPYTLEIGFKDTAMLEAATLIPGVEATDPMSSSFTHDDLPTVMRCCMAQLGLAAKERWESTP